MGEEGLEFLKPSPISKAKCSQKQVIVQWFWAWDYQQHGPLHPWSLTGKSRSLGFQMIGTKLQIILGEERDLGRASRSPKMSFGWMVSIIERGPEGQAGCYRPLALGSRSMSVCSEHEQASHPLLCEAKLASLHQLCSKCALALTTWR